jgi:hypothetical protein
VVNYLNGYYLEAEIWVVLEFMGGGSLTEILEVHNAAEVFTQAPVCRCSNTCS